MLVTGVSLLASKESLAVLVKSEVGHNNVGWVDGNLCLLTVGLLLDELLNVDAPSAAVNFSDFALTVFVGTAHHLDGVSVANRDGTGLILCRQLFAEVSGHNFSAERRGCGEVRLAGLSALAGHAFIKQVNG